MVSVNLRIPYQVLKVNYSILIILNAAMCVYGDKAIYPKSQGSKYFLGWDKILLLLIHIYMPNQQKCVGAHFSFIHQDSVINMAFLKNVT